MADSNFDMFAEETVKGYAPPQDFVDEVAEGLKEALQDAEVQKAFRAMFSNEELDQLKSVDKGELRTALFAALAYDESFQKEMTNVFADWKSTVTVPKSAEELDSFVATWQLSPSGAQPSQAVPSEAHQGQQSSPPGAQAPSSPA